MAIYNSIYSGAAIDSRLGALGRTIFEDGAIGDGVADDRAAIQATIDAVPAGGGLVIIPPGTYRLTKANVNWCLNIVNSNVVLILQQGATLIMADAQVVTQADEVYVVQFGDGVSVYDGMGIKGSGTIDYNAAGQTYTGQLPDTIVRGCLKFDGANTNSIIEDITLLNANGDAILCDGVSTGTRGRGLRITNTFTDNCGEGIVFRFINDVRCSSNTVLNTAGYATPQDAIEPLHCSGVIVSENVIDNVEGSGVDTDGCFNLVISDNIITNYATVAGDGITLSSKQADSQDISVDGNVITGASGVPASFGITSLQDISFKVDNVTITSNTINNSLQAGIRVWVGDSNFTISANTIVNAGENGIKVNGDNVLINGNLILNCGQLVAAQGMVIDGGTGLIISNNIIKDTQATATSLQGIQITNGADNCVFTGNVIEGMGGFGIEINTGVHSITNNRFKNNTRNGTLKRNMYVRTVAADGMVVSGNYIEDGGTTGDTVIHIHATGSNGTYSNNKILDTSTLITPDSMRIDGVGNKILYNDYDLTRLNDDGTSNIVLGNILGTYDITGATTPISQINMINGTWIP